MIKLRYLTILLWILLIPNRVDCSSIARNLTEYDYEDIKDFSKLCSMSYLDSDSDKYLKEMQDKGWNIEPFSIDPLTLSCAGIKACNGPLTVIAYAGTKSFETFFFTDINIVPTNCEHLFPNMQGRGIFHKGFSQFYKNLGDYRT